VVAKVEAQYKYVKAYGHTLGALKALEILSKTRGSKSKTKKPFCPLYTQNSFNLSYFIFLGHLLF